MASELEMENDENDELEIDDLREELLAEVVYYVVSSHCIDMWVALIMIIDNFALISSHERLLAWNKKENANSYR